jgi:hypothetical protein
MENDKANGTAKHWGCPHCGSTRLAHMERAIVLYPVKIADNPRHPGAYLFEYTDELSKVDDENAEDCGGPDNYHCNECSEEFPEPVLTDKDPDDGNG